DDVDTTLAIMRRVLEDDLPGALTEARRQAARAGQPAARQLVTELDDMARGGYATQGNRAFARFASLWRRAREDWVAARSRPAGSMPDSVLLLADDVPYVLAVDLNESVAWLLPGPPTSEMFPSAFYISSGANGAGKSRRGDERTPLGVYWAVDEFDTAQLPARYGSRVLPLDYPNALDRRQRRSGDGIWIHGIDPANNIRPPRDTDGCIAVSEDRIDALVDPVARRVTPVVIGAPLTWKASVDDRAAMVAALDTALEAWIDSVGSRDAAGLLAHYEMSFRDMGLTSAQWRAWRARALETAPETEIRLSSVSHFVADPSAEVFLTRCRQTLNVAGAASVTTWLRLYWQKQNGRQRIGAPSAGCVGLERGVAFAGDE
ncbi:MAG: L,D-transpeptidase family protein, partial [Pseudomonadota bacterium]